MERNAFSYLILKPPLRHMPNIGLFQIISDPQGKNFPTKKMEFQNRFDKNVWNSKGCWQKKNPGIPKQFQQKSLEFQHPLMKTKSGIPTFFQVVKSKKVWNSRCNHVRKVWNSSSLYRWKSSNSRCMVKSKNSLEFQYPL